MSSYFLSNQHIGLNKLTVEQMSKNYYNWLNDKEVTNGVEAGVFPSTYEDIENYVQSASSGKDSVLFGIFSKESNQHIGNIRVSSINYINRTCMIGIIIGEPTGRGKGYGTQACKLVCDYVFEILNLNKIWLFVFEDNPSAKKMYKNIGFEEEGFLKNHFYKNGRYIGADIMSLFKK